MVYRKSCCFKNKDLVNAILKLEEELLKDFSVNLLELCDSCVSNLGEEASRDVHRKLITVYNELSEIKRILKKVN